MMLLTFLAGVALGWWAPRAWKEATEADRLQALHGRPMPRRRQLGGFQWWS